MFGTVFPSRSKPGREAAGVSALAGVVSATTLPVLAVGGIDLATVSSVAFAGAAGFAAISMFADVEIDRIPGMVGESNRAFMTRTGAA
jgi:thiamine monophosphate synthase